MLQISMPRGDIRSVTFSITGDDGEPSDIEFEEIYFTVKKQFTDKHYCFQKRLSNGTIEKDGEGTYSLVIQPSDTDPLEFGQYVFDIELLGDNIKQTTVGKIDITQEATHRFNEIRV